VLRRIAAAGVERVLLVVGADTGPFEVLRPTAERLGLELESVPEPEPLDTAGGVREVADRLRGPALICNGDILTDIDLLALVEHHTSTGATATLSLTRVDDTSSFGVCVREGTRVVDFVEKPEPGTLPGQDTVNAGTYVLDPEALLRFEPGRLSFERAVFPQLLEDGEVIEGFVWDGAWADLGTPARLRRGTRMALDGALAWPAVDNVPAVRDGVRIAPGAQVADGVELRGPLLVHAGASIGADVELGPHVVVGHDTRVGDGAHLRDTVLGSDTEVGARVRATGLATGPGAVLPDDLTVLGDTVVGPGARVPQGSGPLPAGTRIPEPRD
jgi:NDP-sugar pyrophosphorylase family protein